MSKDKDSIKSMEEYQRKYFPNSVGVKCPYCGEKIKPKDNPYIEKKKGESSDG